MEFQFYRKAAPSGASARVALGLEFW
jgi:hypothetical protein